MKILLSPDSHRKSLSKIFSQKISDEIKRYCQNDKYSNKSYDEIKSNVDFVKKTYPEIISTDEFKGLSSLVTSELNYSGQAMWLSSNLNKKIKNQTALFSDSYDWNDNPVNTWYNDLKSKIYKTTYVSKNNDLDTYFTDGKVALNEWNDNLKTYKSEYLELSRIKKAHDDSKPITAISSYMLCDQFSVEEVKQTCRIYKDRSFIRFMGCGISGSNTIGSHADLDCLRERASDCRKIRQDKVYYKRCLEMTKIDQNE